MHPAGGIGCVAGLAVARKVEGDQPVIFCEPSLQLMAENATAGRIAVDQEYRYAALTTLLDRELAVRCDDGVLPSRTVHARYPCLLASANGHYSPFIDLVISPPQEG